MTKLLRFLESAWFASLGHTLSRFPCFQCNDLKGCKWRRLAWP